MAIETADLVLMSGDPAGVVQAVELSRTTMRNIRQNLGWAFGYNVALIPVAAGVLYPVRRADAVADAGRRGDGRLVGLGRHQRAAAAPRRPVEAVMNIAEVARRSGLPPKTIRYYEEIGLIRPGRRDNGYRDFAETDLHKLAFLGRARSLGFSIEECRTLLALYEDRARASADVKAIAQDHLDAIDAKIAELQAMRATLSTLVAHCAGDDRPDCPILADLAGGTTGCH